MREITNSDDVIDSRDVIARIEELEAEREALAEAMAEATEALGEAETALADIQASLDELAECSDEEDTAKDALEEAREALDTATEALQDWDDDNGAELAALKALAEKGEGWADWPHGETLIRDSYFEDYARELADDCGMIPDGPGWPCNCIDWEKAARELQYDYSTVDFDGVTYWIRSC